MSQKKDKPTDANSLALAFLVDLYYTGRVDGDDPVAELAERLRQADIVQDNAVFLLRWLRGQFTAYRDGADHPLSEKELRAIVAGYLVKQDVHVSRRLVSDIIEVLAGLVRIDDDREPPFWLQSVNGAEVISASNGNISQSDRDSAGRPRLLRHSPLYYSLMAPLPFDYVPDATCPIFRHFLAEIMGGDVEYVALLEELLGYCFVPANPFQAFFLLLGAGANGKSTFMRLAEWIVGPANTSHVPLARFGDRFILQQMHGRRLNSTSETIRHVDDVVEANLKAASGCDTIAAEVKFQQDHVIFTPSAKICISTNQMPRFRDTSEGLWRRLWLIPFPISIPQSRQDPALVDKLRAEGPGILNLALAARDRLLSQGGFTVPADRVRLLDEIRRDLDPVRDFLTTAYQESPNGEFIPCNEMYSRYTNWAHSVGVRMVDERVFGRRVRDVFPASDRRQRGGRGCQTWCYLGIMPRTPSTPTNSHSRAQGEKEQVNYV